MEVTVRVPASSANLGPGFDILAMALQLQNTVVAAPRDDGSVVIEVTGPGAGELDDPQRNRTAQAWLRCCEELGVAPGVTLRCENSIPLRRGLGSSAAAALAGIIAASALHGGAWDDADILERAAQWEGHRDNAAAALHGGLVICAPGAPVVHVDVPNELRCVVFVPDAEMPTDEARRVVPRQLSREDAIFNAARCALLVRAVISSDWAMLRTAMEDRWHQQARTALMPRLAPLLEAAHAAGAAGACLSGAGPSVLALCSGETAAVEAAMAAAGGPGEVLVLAPRNHGMRVDVRA